jgi:hypothetical protein
MAWDRVRSNIVRSATGRWCFLLPPGGAGPRIKAFKEGTIPFPDGAIIAALHWNVIPSEDNSKILASKFPGAQSFVVGSAVNVLSGSYSRVVRIATINL